jgi:hypothetical protein
MLCSYVEALKYFVVVAIVLAACYSFVNLLHFFRGWKHDWDGKFEKPSFRGVEYDIAFTSYFYRRKYRSLPDKQMICWGDGFVRGNFLVAGVFIVFLVAMIAEQRCGS